MSVHIMGKSETQDKCSYPNIMTDTPIEGTVKTMAESSDDFNSKTF